MKFADDPTVVTAVCLATLTLGMTYAEVLRWSVQYCASMAEKIRRVTWATNLQRVMPVIPSLLAVWLSSYAAELQQIVSVKHEQPITATMMAAKPKSPVGPGVIAVTRDSAGHLAIHYTLREISRPAEWVSQ